MIKLLHYFRVFQQKFYKGQKMKQIFTLCITGLIIIIAAGRPAAGEGKWEWYNPLPGGQPIQMEKIGADTALALCPFGMLVSTDQGETWQYKPVVQDSAFVNMSISESGAIWAGNRRDLLKSTNMGDSWETIRQHDKAIEQIYFINDEKGFIFSPELIYRTTDGGQSWDTTGMPSYCLPRSIFFFNDTHGWGCGEDGGILRTTDGGDSWEFDKIYWKGIFRGVYFQTEKYGYMFGEDAEHYDDGDIYKTTDGGESWRLDGRYRSDTKCKNWDFFDRRGVQVGRADSLIKYDFTGFNNKWESFAYEHDAVIENVLMFSYDIFVGWDSMQRLVKSTDGGQTWEVKSYSMVGSAVNKIYFQDENKGWILSGGAYYTTSDAGENWTENSIGSGHNYLDIAFIDDNTGFMAAKQLVQYNPEYYLFRTENGGESWDDISSGNMQHKILGITPGGVVLSLANDGELYRSTDKGNNWDTISIESFLYGHNFGIADENTYIVFCESSPRKMYFITTDAGATWTGIDTIHYGIGNYCIEFMDEQTALVGGAKGHIYKTTDGCQTWELKSSTEENFRIKDIKFIDENLGWAVGTESAFFETTDGGESWYFKKGLIDGDLKTICIAGSGSAWIGGDKGTIIKYTGDGSPVAETYVSKEEISVMNYPNPFRDMTTLRFNLKTAAHVSTKIYDLSGQVVADLGSKYINPGDYEMQWQPGGLPSGVYFLRISNGKTTAERKLILGR